MNSDHPPFMPREKTLRRRRKSIYLRNLLDSLAKALEPGFRFVCLEEKDESIIFHFAILEPHSPRIFRQIGRAFGIAYNHPRQKDKQEMAVRAFLHKLGKKFPPSSIIFSIERYDEHYGLGRHTEETSLLHWFFSVKIKRAGLPYVYKKTKKAFCKP